MRFPSTSRDGPPIRLDRVGYNFKPRFHALAVAVAALFAFFPGRWGEGNRGGEDHAGIPVHSDLDSQGSDKVSGRKARSATSSQRKIQELRI